MLAVHLENGVVSIVCRPRPRRLKGFALIRLLCGGICNTDLELQRGYYGFRGVPGHEFVGRVVEADSPVLVGRRVVGEINLACGGCDWCRRGLGRHCPRRSVLGIVRHPGAFQEFFVLPERNLHVVPDHVSDERAVFAEPVAAACEILDQVRIPRGAPVAVLGDGKLGRIIAQVLAAHGAEVHLFGRQKPRRPSSAAFNWVVEATGAPEGLRQAVALTRPRGTVILKSTVHGEVSLDTAPVVVNEISLVGSRCGRFEPALKLLAGRKLRVEKMISARFSLSEAPQAFARAAQAGTLKVLMLGQGGGGPGSCAA
ncbi:MAG: alcohol dehydrogenase catalytic domain-containing protein [Acidobacteria bacterium]|nr:alcohol dehydrogenase catalytic domain-containing protein [Acidobacteriota bacterium]